MDILIAIYIMFFISIGLIAYQFSRQKLVQEVHLPPEITGEPGILVKFFSLPDRLIDRLIARKGSIPFIDNLKRRLTTAGRPINPGQLLALKLLLMISLPILAFTFFRSRPLLILLALAIGYVFPDFWVKNQIKKRQTAILRNLPHIIDLLNICVGAGLDFMVAVNRVTQEFHSCELIEELKVMVREIQMGSSRREALKNLASRVNSTEMVSFVRTLLQADRMGTPIGEALKMQSEEIRIRRFQRGEEAALKAPIKLLLPLLFFILPVVLIIVAGPILIQFSRGGMMKF